MINTFIKNYHLIFVLTKRDILGRYKGSFAGLLWSFLVPLLMLIVYTFVFSVIFQAKWNVESDSKVEFALILFTGLMFFNLFSECMNKSPSTIISNINYVKKVVFPLEILPIISLCSSLYHLCISMIIWLLFYLIFFGMPPFTIIQLPILLVSFLLFILGCSWFLAALGVYVKDVGQLIGVIVTICMFLTPIFYPITIVPENLRGIMLLSPLTFMVEEARSVMVFGSSIRWGLYILHLLASIIVFFLGYTFFIKTQKGFSDVL